MRRALGFLLPVLVVATGCLWSGPFGNYANVGPPTGDKDRTLEYWGKLRTVTAQRSKSDDLRALTNIIQKQVDLVHNEPTERVDPELIAAAEALAKSQEKVIEVAEIADFQLAGLRASPAAAKEFSQANQQASAAIMRLKALRSKLAARYGIAFPPLDE